MACSAFWLFLLVLCFLVGCAVQQPKIQPFYCNATQTPDYLREVRINRLFKNGNILYFILDDRVVFTKKFFENKRTGESSIVVHHFYQQRMEDLTMEELGFSDLFNLIGHHHDGSTNRTVEFYAFSSGLKLYFGESGFELDFNEVKGDRKRLANLWSIRIEDADQSLYQFLNEQYYLVYTDIDCNPEQDYCFVARTKAVGKSQKPTFQLFFVPDNEKERLLWPAGDYDDSKATIVAPYVIYFNSIDVRRRKNSIERRFEAVLVAIEQAPPKKFYQTPLFHIVYVRRPDATQANQLSSITVPVHELFSCHTPFRNSTREVKGIVYEPGSGIFYIFIRRFFLRFNEDLVKAEFNFDENAYNNSGVLEFESDEVQRNVRFEIRSSRLYIKTFPERARFVPNDQTFELISKDDALIAQLLEESRLNLANCPGNTMVLKSRYVFCFFQNNSYTLYFDLQKPTHTAGGNKHYSTPSIFPDKIWKEQLRFIFNYKNDSIVFMTDRQLYILRNANFEMDLTELKYVPDKNYPLQTKRNCLFDPNCKPPSPITTPSTTSLNPTGTTPGGFSPDLVVTSETMMPPSIAPGASTVPSKSTLSPFDTSGKTTQEPLGFLDQIWAQVKKTMKNFKLQLIAFVALLIAILLIVFFLTRKRKLKKDSPIEAKFFRSKPFPRSEAGSSEKWQAQSQPQSQASKVYEEKPSISKPSRVKDRFSTRSVWPRNAFSSLFMNSPQASSVGKLPVRGWTPDGRSVRSSTPNKLSVRDSTPDGRSVRSSTPNKLSVQDSTLKSNKPEKKSMPALIYRFISSITSGQSSQPSASASTLRASDFHSSPFLSKKLASSKQQAGPSSSQAKRKS